MTSFAARPQQSTNGVVLTSSRQRVVRLLFRGCATTAIVFGAPVNLRTLSDFGPPR